MRVFLCGGVAVEVDGRRLPEGLLAGRQGRLVLAYLVCERQRSVTREELAELLWGDRLPASWTASLSAVVSRLRHLLTEAGLDGGAALASTPGGYQLVLPDDAWVDWDAATEALTRAERALHDGQAEVGLASAIEAEQIAQRGFITDDSLWVDEQRERLRDLRVRAVQIQAEAHMLLGARGSAVIAAQRALELEPLQESSFRLVMRALAAAGERGEALRTWERCRTMLVEELGADPAPETEAVYLAILRDDSAPPVDLPTGVVTFLLTDIVDSSGLWERNPTAMAAALERHDALVADAARVQGGTMLKAKLEGDATVSVFPRASAGALAALNLRDALEREPWPPGTEPQVRMALHTGEAVERAGDYVGPALNRAARLRGLATGGQILASQAIAEVVRDHLPAWAALRSLGHRQLRGLSRSEHVFELVAASVDDEVKVGASPGPATRPPLPLALTGVGPFVGRGDELDRLTSWATATSGTARAILIAGEPGVGKTRLAGELAQRAHADGALVLYGRCDEDLGAPYQPFAEALRSLVAAVGPEWARSVRGIDVLTSLVPELSEPGSDPRAPARGDADTERYLLFDAVVRLLAATSAEMPVVLVLDDLQWAGKPTLLMLRHLLRFDDGARLRVVGTYRNTDLDRSHPLAATLADLQRDGTAERVTLTGLAELEVSAYLRAAGHDDQLAPTLSAVTAGNPFFLIETLRNVEETGGRWDASTLPQGVREAVGRRLSRLSEETNEALLVGAVAGVQFALDVVERAMARDAVDAVDEACHAGILIEEPGGRFRFNHALVRQTLLAEAASVKRVRLHQRLAEALEDMAPAGGEGHLPDLAHHYFECAWAGRAAKAVDYCRRAADQAMARLAYEEAADLYDRAAQAADIDTAQTREVAERAELLIARCEALLAAGDMAQAAGAVAQLAAATRESPRLRAWATCFDAQLAVLTHPERLDETEQAVAAAAEQLENLHDAAGEAKAHTVRASCLARLGRVADCEGTLDRALAAARRAGDDRRVNAVLAGAPLAALWGPSQLPRASGRCLDVIRVLRITTGSPVVETNALRCQAVLEAMRGRVDAARRLLGQARATLEDLGLRTALLDLDMYAGVVELIAGQPERAATTLRTAYQGFAQLGDDVDTAQAAALLARACLLLGLDAEADQLSAESAQLGGRDLKTAIAWRAVRAELLASRGQTDEALRLAEEAVALAASTDALVDHGDACLALAAVHRATGDANAAQAAAERAATLYERKGATALATRAGRSVEAAAQTTPPEPRPPVLDNAATTALRRAAELVLAGDWKTAERSTAPSAQIEDRRSGLAATYPGRDRVLANARFIATGFDRVRITPIAIRGERLALATVTWSGAPGGDTFEIEALLLHEIDVERRTAAYVLFDPGALLAAIDELDSRYLAGEGVAHTEVVSLVGRVLHHINAQDWTALRALFADDFVFVDHTRLGAGMLGPDDLVARSKTTAELTSDFTAMCATYLEFATYGAVMENRGLGSGLADGVFELAAIDVVIVSGSRLSRMERFSLSRREEAVRRFDELRAGADLSTPGSVSPLAAACPENAASRIGRVALEGPADSGTLVGTPAALDAFGRAMPAAQVVTLAIRGDRLAVLSVTGPRQSADGAAPTALMLVEVDAGGQLAEHAVWEATDLPAAVRELDERWAAEVPPDVWAWARSMIETYNAGDFAKFRALHAEGSVNVDRRVVGWGTSGLDDVVRRARELREMVPDLFGMMVVIHRITPRGAVGRMRQSGTGPDGTSYEALFESVAVVRDGRQVHSEYLPAGHVEEAVRRFEELTSDEPSAIAETDALQATCPENLASQVARAMFDTTADSEAPAGSRAAHVMETVAIRGDHLALVRLAEPSDGSDPRRGRLAVVEVDESGRIQRRHHFAGADLPEAVRTLDDWDPNQVGWTVYRAWMDAFNSGDWERWRSVMADDFVNVDERPVGWGVVNADELVRRSRHLREMAPDVFVIMTVIHRGMPDGQVGRARQIGTGPEGSFFEKTWETLVLVRGDKAVRCDYLPVGHVDEALRRFEGLIAEFTTEPVVPENAAAALAARLETRINARDREGALSCGRRDLLVDDRRAGLRSTVEAKASERELDFLWSHPFSHVHGSTIAVRGDRLALRQQTYAVGSSRADAAIVEFLTVHEIDTEGRLVAQIRFDIGDLAAAMAELDERYAAGLPPDVAEAWNLSRASAYAYHSQPEEDLRRLFTDDFTLDDRRATGWGTIDLDRWMELRRELLDMTTSVSSTIPAVHGLAPHGAAARITQSGTTNDGTRFEMVFEAVSVIRAGKVARLEFMPAGQVDEALRRLEELAQEDGSGSMSVPENPAAALVARVEARVNARDLDGALALASPDVLIDDRRAGLRGEYAGTAASERELDFFWSYPSARVDGLTVAVRGDRYTLRRQTYTVGTTSADMAIAEVLTVNEIDADGRLLVEVRFDPDDLAGAVRELDGRYIAGLPAEQAESVALARDALGFLNAGDWAALRGLMTDDFVNVDHRVTGWGTVDRDEWIGLVQQLKVLAPDRVAFLVVVHRCAPDGIVARVRITGTGPEASPFEMLWEMIGIRQGGRWVRTEYLPAGHVDEALRRFEDLAPD